MNKKLLAILTAALLALSATACTEGEAPNDTTADGTKNPNESYIVVGTDEEGNPVTSVNPETESPETQFDPTEDNPVFTDASMQIVVFAGVATVRTSTQITDNNAVGWPSEGRVLEVTGESDNWYRIVYPVNGEDKECYIAKTVAADASVLDEFTAIEGGEEVVVSVEAVNVRSYPSTASDLSIRASLKLGTKVTRVAVSEKWSRIVYEVVSETETNEDGTPVTTTKEYYISNDCLNAPSAETTGEAATEAAN